MKKKEQLISSNNELPMSPEEIDWKEISIKQEIRINDLEEQIKKFKLSFNPDYLNVQNCTPIIRKLAKQEVLREILENLPECDQDKYDSEYYYEGWNRAIKAVEEIINLQLLDKENNKELDKSQGSRKETN